ncbi:hypothetical protein [Pantoea sp. B65]|uniref:hypothetical protein n=1 Tax=Pantoea sp. B65 TaxID=2813359 RepID=UPI0039B5A89B
MTASEKPSVRYLLLLIGCCVCAMFCTIALVELGIWLYYRLILAIPSGMSWQLSLMKSLRSAVAVGPIAGLGVWLHAWLAYREGKKK